MFAKFLVSASLVFLMTSTAQAATLKFTPGEDSKFNWKSFEDFKASHSDLKGQTITIFGPWRGEDESLFQSVLAYFGAATGTTFRYSSSENYEQQILIDAQAGSPPDIAILPQVGLLADLAEKGLLKPIGEDNATWVKENYGAGKSWADLGTFTGKDGRKAFYAFPYKADLKSLVWYIPENFEESGYEIPKSMEELFALSDKIVADGGTPWCIGLGSGSATGWPATDWVEEIILRQQPLQTYLAWTTNDVKFTDPIVISAINEFGKFAKNGKYVSGGIQAVAATDYRDSPKGLFDIPPKCYLHRQASFVASFFPSDKVVGEDVDFFYLPPYASKPELGRPVLGGGTLFAKTKESAVADAFIEFLKTPIAHEVWMAQASFLTPFKGANVATYANDPMRRQGEILTSATTFGFDGSDLMPGKIGAGSFWTGMIDFVGGKSAEDVAASIQRSWDAIKNR